MFQNGRIPASALKLIDGTHYAAPGCVSGWRAWSNHLVSLGYPPLTVGTAADAAYRSYEWQQYRWNLRQRDHSAPVAAYPGTSNHGWGLAVDIGNYYRYPHKVLVSTGRKFGFVFDTPSEAWHVRYTGTANYLTATITKTTLLETIMALDGYELIYTTDNGKEYAVLSPLHLPDGYLRSTSVNTATNWSALIGATARKVKSRTVFEGAVLAARQWRDLSKA